MASIWERVKGFAGLVTAVASVMTLAWAGVSKMGLVVSRAEASDMITIAVQQAASDTNAALLDEVKARQLADLRFQLAAVNDDITELLNSGDLSAAEADQLEQLKKTRDQINAQIVGFGQ